MNRLFKEGLITTIIGIGLILFSIVMFYSHKGNLVEITGWLGLALAFLRAKDSLIGLDNKD